MNQGVHYADLLCWIFGPPEVEAARCATLDHDIAVEDIALALLRFPGDHRPAALSPGSSGSSGGHSGGALGTLVASTLSYPGSSTVLSVNAAGGSLELVDGALVGLDMKEGSVELLPEDVRGIGFPDGHRAQLADVIACLRQGRPAPVSGEDGYQALKLVLDVYKAAGWPPPR
jgi:predicted dehydrogenase